jgi:hypothetical protein
MLASSEGRWETGLSEQSECFVETLVALEDAKLANKQDAV